CTGLLQRDVLPDHADNVRLLLHALSKIRHATAGNSRYVRLKPSCNLICTRWRTPHLWKVWLPQPLCRFRSARIRPNRPSPRLSPSRRPNTMTEWNAQEYDRLSALQATMAAEVLALLRLKSNERVLDVGCGNGKVTAAIAERVPQGSVLGVDASADMISFAKEHWPAGRPNLEFAVADARHLPFKAEFDLVVSFNALHWITDQTLPLQAIHRALK